MTNREIKDIRQPDYDIDPIYLQRWSSRSFSDRDVSDDDLFSLLEAARWAPSANNIQPWRFIVARKKEDREKFYEFILPGNRLWCEKAPALVLIFSHRLDAKGRPNPTHAFDTGTAWGYLALEATRKGLVAHAMSGFEPEKARKILNIPEEYELHAVVAIGYRGEREALPEALQEREKPSMRRPLSESVYEGEFGRATDRD